MNLNVKENFFKAFLDSSPDPFFAKDMEDNFIYVNKAFLDLFNLEEVEVLGKREKDVFMKAGCDRLFMNNEKTQDGMSKISVETLKFKDGVERLYLLRSRSFDVDGESVCVCAFFDTGEMYDSDLYLKDHLFSRSFLLAPTAMILLSFENNTVIDLNDKALELLKYSKLDIVGKNFFETGIFSQEDVHTFNLLLDQYGEYENVEVFFNTGAGESEYALVSGKIERINGESYVILSILNITNRKKKLDSLLLHKSKAHRMFENMPMGFLVADTDGNILHLNTLSYKLLGSPSKEATRAINILEFSSLIESGISGKISKCIETKKMQYIETLYVSKWGKKIYIQMWIVPLFDEDLNIEYVQVLFDDISSNKFEEEKLMKSEKYYRELFDNVGMLVVILDANLNFAQVNGKFLDYVGKTKDLVEGKMNWQDFLVNADEDLFFSRFMNKSGVLISENLSYESKIKVDVFDEAKNFFITVRSIPSLNQYIVSMLDVSERISVEKALEFELETRKNLELSINDGPLVVFSFKNDAAWPVDFVSKNVKKFYGYSESDLIDCKFLDLVHEDDRMIVRNKIMNLIVARVYNFTLKYRFLAKDRSFVWVEHKIWINQKNGQVKSFNGVLMDISEQKKALEKSNELNEHLGHLKKNVTALVDLNKRGNVEDLKVSILNSASIISMAKICVFYDFDEENDLFEISSLNYLRGSKDYEKENRILNVSDFTWLKFVVNSMTRYRGHSQSDDLAKLNVNQDIETFLFLPLIDDGRIKHAIFFGFDETKMFSVDEYRFFDLFVMHSMSILKLNKI